jgi:serine phosphatase RsbU (regulator of sigma subunit)
MYRIYGLDPASPRAASRAAVAAATHPEDVPLGAAARDRALADHEPFVLEQRLVHPDGDLRHVVTRGEVVTTADGAVVGMRGTTQDVTEQRRAATAAAAAREQLLRRTIELAEEHRVKEALQRAVLPRALPVRAGIELAARYLAADRPALVGGDWYDAYGLPDGSLALAVGDVVGHDLDAAATMGQLRNALRAYAATGEPPARVLTRLNQLTTQAQGGLATVVYGRLAPDLRAFRWASAGHPPPLLLTESGTSFLTPAAGAMLGAHPSTPYGTVRTPLRAGQTLLLYTDGLIERRDRDLDTGSALLADATHDLGGLPLDAVCDTLLSRLLPDQAHEDDVCLLTLRLTSPPHSQAIARSSPGRAVPVRRVGKRPQVT